MKSRLILTSLAAAALMAAPLAGRAADLGRPIYKGPTYVAPLVNWTGFYIGLNAGYGFGKSEWDFPAASVKPDGFLGGGTIGVNQQTGDWVWGLEADIDYSAMSGSADCPLGVTCETKNSWLATGRGRIGYAAWTGLLPYVTGGAALGDIKASNSLLNSASKTNFGYAVGAGLEYAMARHWSVKAEYLYVDLGKFDCGLACGGVTSDDVTFKTNIVRGGINYKF